MTFKDYIKEQYKGQDISKIKSINTGSKGFKNLDGIQDFKSLEEFYCFRNKLTTLDCLSGLPIKTLDFSNNGLESLDFIKGLDYIEELYFMNNNITDLSILKDRDLKELDCENNGIKTLEGLQYNKNIVWLDISCNYISEADFSGFTKLKDLYCNNNNITDIVLEGCDALTELEIDHNPIKAQDLYRQIKNLPVKNINKNILRHKIFDEKIKLL